MNCNTFRLPVRRLSAVAVCTALAAVPAVLTGAGPALAADGHGRAEAAVLRTDLDVSLLDQTVDVPLTTSLNEVSAPRTAPRTAQRTALTAELDGVDHGRPFSLLRADVARAEATVGAERAEAGSRLVNARLRVPGLAALSLVELSQVSARAVCAAGAKPVAEASLPGSVTVLGKRITLSSGGTTEVKVPGVGEVRLDLAERTTTGRTAAASALRLHLSVNPLKLNVAGVEGTVTIASARCTAPDAAPPASAAPTRPATDTRPQQAEAPKESNLAETGGSSATPYLVIGAALLLAAGGTALAVTRHRRNG
ncbi:SCO1860 family LAETG-anchored protein [Streptomyces sp. NPDC058045]|uniref:SCO1860 family LAETG-anchored protein n=1 Tax=Streptomyces sp. NPDC058045 TaxID=3346311 RepID=UPI0036E7473B